MRSEALFAMTLDLYHRYRNLSLFRPYPLCYLCDVKNKLKTYNHGKHSKNKMGH